MFKLIIIDDEVYILKQLSSLIDWKALGFELAEIFESSENIFEYLENNHTDAIVSDISMPAPNGLDIAEYCYNNMPETQVVLVSGYRDFEYAQAAIKFRVFEYITKPIAFDAFFSCMQSLSQKLHEQSERRRHFIDSELLFSFQETFSDLVCGCIKSKDELKKSVTGCGLPESILVTPCATVSVRISNFTDFIKRNKKYELSDIYTIVSNLIPFETDFTYNIFIRYAYNNLELLVINKCSGGFEKNLSAQLETIRTNLENIMNVKTDIRVSKTYPSLISIISDTDESEITSYTNENDIIKKVDNYIKSNYKNEITLDDIARYTSMSKGYFCSYYKSRTNESFITALNNYRIERAKELLKDPKTKSSNVGSLVGFKNMQHFYRVFKSSTGLTPGSYQSKVTLNE